MKNVLLFILFSIIFSSWGFSQEVIEEEIEEEIIKDFVVSLLTGREVRFDEVKFTNDFVFYFGLAIETELKYNITNEIFLAIAGREDDYDIRIEPKIPLKSTFLFSYSEKKEKIITIRQRFKYRFSYKDIRPFIGLGIGLNYYFDTDYYFNEGYRNQSFYETTHRANEGFLAPTLNGGVGLDWYVFNHLVLSTSLDGIYNLSYRLKRQFPTLSESGLNPKRLGHFSPIFSVRIGYNFFN